jgi:hypothetical protein
MNVGCYRVFGRACDAPHVAQMSRPRSRYERDAAFGALESAVAPGELDDDDVRRRSACVR